jgi:glutathione S-transferase
MTMRAPSLASATTAASPTPEVAPVATTVLPFIRKKSFASHPDPSQLAPNERVERIRRIQGNNVENIPFSLAGGLLYVLTAPSLVMARLAFYGYVVSRFLHFLAYLTAWTHDVRSIFWTIGSLILIFMTVRALMAALGV